ncbi:MAG: triose-phosphate isomerase [Minisyncoccia bacterium]
MKTGIPPLVIGNWKMNPQSESIALKLSKELKSQLLKKCSADVVVAPPYVYLEAVHRVRNGSNLFMMGAQNVHYEKLGAHTGEISLPMLQNYSVTHVILGHSERRAEGETDEKINQKLLAVIKAGMTGVVCVGELKRDHSGHYLSHIEAQVRKALIKVSKSKLGHVVIAYEPIWAIGTGTAATTADVHEMKLFIEKIISDLYGRNLAQKVRIIYGGSVTGKNAAELYAEGMIDGFLVGGASLHVDDFMQIIKSGR